MNNQYKGLHPGLFLKKELDNREISQRQFAIMLKRPYQMINEIINEKKRITAETAVQFEEILSIPAIEWLYLQSDYDLFIIRSKLLKLNFYRR